jgi:multimeric flavodoxin WrbA/putative sterol carrier protein
VKVNIYYGGRGLMDDPTLYVINKMQKVLEELNVKVERFMLCELKNTITTLPQTLKDADGIILATTVEWYGIGGYMMQFLDACWLYADKEKLSKIYMSPIVMSTTYGEREGKLNLSAAWEILGGRPCSGMCGYIADTAAFEMNDDYSALIEKKAENIYRTINQKVASLPASNQAVKQRVSVSQNTDLTPQESERLSQYAADDSYVQQQKEDIQELSSLFKGMLEKKDIDVSRQFIKDFEDNFAPEGTVNASYKFMIEDRKKPLIVEIVDSKLKCYYGSLDSPDILCKIKPEVLEHIIAGQMSFQRAFMTGDMQVKGDFRILLLLDQVFTFLNSEGEF